MKRTARMRQTSTRPAPALSLGLVAALVIALAPLAGGCKKEKGGAGKGGQPGQPAATQPAEPAAASAFEISANPAVLADPAVAPAQYELYGGKLGDPRSALVANGITAAP